MTQQRSAVRKLCGLRSLGCRFSLQSLVFLVSTIGCCLGLYVNEANQQREAVSQIKALGGTVWYDCEYDSTAGIYLRLPPRGWQEPAWLRSLLGVDFFHSVESVRLTNSRFCDADVCVLEKLPAIRRLCIASCNVTDVGVSRLADQGVLRSVHLRHCRVTDVGAQHLSRLRKLQDLTLEHTLVTEDGAHLLTRLIPECRVVVR